MAKVQTLDMILETAEDIEMDAASFYAQGAAAVDDVLLKSLLSTLGDDERKHAACFKKARAQLAATESPLKAAAIRKECEEYVSAMGNTMLRQSRKSVATLLRGSMSSKTIMEFARQQERDSIAYYTGLRQLVEGPQLKVIDNIIREEMRHFCALQDELQLVGRALRRQSAPPRR